MAATTAVTAATTARGTSSSCSRTPAYSLPVALQAPPSLKAVCRGSGRPQAQAQARTRWSATGRVVRCSSSNGSSSSTATTGATDYETLGKHKVFAAASGQEVLLPSLWQAQPGTRCVVACLSHFGDLTSTELAQKLLAVLPEFQEAGVGLLVVGLGEVDKARKFSQLLGFPIDILYADPTGDLYRALGFNPGFLPDAPISPYAKLLPMLAGIGSPGTIQEVLRGYVGDRSAKPVFSSSSGSREGSSSSSEGSGGAGPLGPLVGSGGSNLFDVLGKGYQRPFELATLRLFNMNTVLSNWAELAPSDERLLTQQGGTLGFDGQKEIFRHADAGILKYVDVDQLVAAVLPDKPSAATPSQVLRTLL